MFDEVDLSVSEQLRLADAISVFSRLTALDGAWTAIARRGNVGGDDLDALSSVVEEMNQLIGRTVEAAYEVLEIAKKAEPPSSVPEGAFSDEAAKSLFETLLDQEGGVVGLAGSAYNTLRDSADSDRAMLDDQMATLRAGGSVDGDLSRRFSCALAKALMAAGGITIWVPPHVHAVASVSAGASMYAALKCWELEPAPKPEPE